MCETWQEEYECGCVEVVVLVLCDPQCPTHMQVRWQKYIQVAQKCEWHGGATKSSLRYPPETYTGDK